MAATGAAPQGQAAEAYIGRCTRKEFGAGCWRAGVVQSTRADDACGQLWSVEYDDGETFEQLGWAELCATLAAAVAHGAPGAAGAQEAPPQPPRSAKSKHRFKGLTWHADTSEWSV
jgi:hypothetical protein